MNISHFIGLSAAMFTTISFLPQVYHSLRTRDTRSISLGMYSVFTVGTGLWLTYGLLIHDLPVTLANAVTLALASAVLALKLRYR